MKCGRCGGSGNVAVGSFVDPRKHILKSCDICRETGAHRTTGEWRDMASAPTGAGARILAWDAQSPGSVVIVMRNRRGGWSSEAWDDGGYDADMRLTHWMPLPDGPG